MTDSYDVIVIGGGAAGCLAAIQAGTHFPGAHIRILEKGNKPLAKVRISGGGRCNVTNVLSEPSDLAANYPRGERFLKKAFYTFSSNHMKSWLSEKGVELRLYPDGCYFPESNDSETIIACFLKELERLKIQITTSCKVDKIIRTTNGWIVEAGQEQLSASKLILTAGGQPKMNGFQLLDDLNLKIVNPVPSLFTFNMPDEPIRELMGIVQEHASVKIAGEKWSCQGPLLITHWGMSGPAVLKCSAFGARVLETKGYQSTILVNWTGTLHPDDVRKELEKWSKSEKRISNVPQFGIKSRLWLFLLKKAGIREEQRWVEMGPKQLNRLCEVIANDTYLMKGKTTFKEEFVTAGGIDLGEIDVKTMQSKKYNGLFFAGEVMDIDGITGGFNFQAAWTTAYIAGKSVLLNETR